MSMDTNNGEFYMNKHKLIEGVRALGELPFPVDCDDTLIMYDMSEHGQDDAVEIFNPYSKMYVRVIPNKKNINTLIKFKKLGYYVLLWSKTGKLWADAVMAALKLEDYVDQTLGKPNFFLDDKPAEEWMQRVYREPNSEYGS